MASFLYLLVCLGILVTVHELGHFLAARACGVKVLRFSIGFGQILYKYTSKKTGCEYAISAIPLGGYVKMEGENTPSEDEDSASSKLSADSFKSKSVLQRAIIIFAGPFFNIVLALFLFTVVNLMGVSNLTPVVGDVIPDSAASVSGFKNYDRIIEIDGVKTKSWQDIGLSLISEIGSDRNFSIKVTSDFGKGQSRDLKMNLGAFTLERDSSVLDLVGLRPCVGIASTKIRTIVKDSPAQKAFLKSGDIIKKIDGVEVDSWYRIQDAISHSDFNELKFVVLRDGDLYETAVKPEAKTIKSGKTVPFVGIGADVTPVEGLIEVVDYSLGPAFVKAFDDCLRMSKMVLVSIYKLFNGSISSDNISGPISIAKGASESAGLGFASFLTYLALISVNLGIFNLLPVPVLDGGQLVFLGYEAVMKKEPSAHVQKILTLIGLTLLLSLMVFAIFNDIRSIF